MNAIVSTRESFEEWYHPNFFNEPKTLAWESWKQSRKDTLEEAAMILIDAASRLSACPRSAENEAAISTLIHQSNKIRSSK